MPNSGRWGTSSSTSGWLPNWTRGWAAWPHSILAVAAVITVICIVGMVYFATTYSIVTATACMNFNGRTECRTATGVSRDLARSSAVRSACNALAAGRQQAAACVQTTPSSVTYR